MSILEAGSLTAAPLIRMEMTMQESTELTTTESSVFEAIESGLKGAEFDSFFEKTTSFDPREFVMRRC